jgi:heavy metal sensor kinase
MMALRPRTVRARLTLWYTIVLAVPLIVFALASYFIFARTLINRTDSFIRDGLQVFARELVVERTRTVSFADAARRTAVEVRFQDLDIIVFDSAGEFLAMTPRQPDEVARISPDSARLHAAVRARARDTLATTLADGQSVTHRIVVQRTPFTRGHYILAGAYPMFEVQTTLQRIRFAFFIAIPILIAAAATGGYFLAKRSLAPVAAMAARAAAIGAATLHERLPVAADDELGALARVLNDLLDRLEASFAQQRRFMADASHELRTPASIVRSEADVTLAREHRAEEEYRESMTIVQDAARRLTRIVDDIFLLARADAGHLVMENAPLALEDVVHNTARVVRPIADRRDVHVELGSLIDAPFHGDEDLLGRVVLNLIDNAVKHAHAGGRVVIDMHRNGGWYDVTVTDDGPGIPGDVHDRIFDRFFRADPARSRAEHTATSGAGLGLAIARRIAELHNGHLDLIESRPGRTVFRLRLPAAPAARRA